MTWTRIKWKPLRTQTGEAPYKAGDAVSAVSQGWQLLYGHVTDVMLYRGTATFELWT